MEGGGGGGSAEGLMSGAKRNAAKLCINDNFDLTKVFHRLTKHRNPSLWPLSK